jgi:hypothetical protein
MSMMGEFREIPLPILGRLKADPSLVEAIIDRGSGEFLPPSPDPAAMTRTMEGMKAMLAANGNQILSQLPAAQRQMIESLPSEQQALFFQKFAEQIMTGLPSNSRSIPPAARKSAVVPAQDLGALLELEKAWHGLHYLLTGNAQEATPGAGQAVLGGTDIGPDLGYGPARLLTPGEVATVSAALAVLTPDILRARFDPVALDEAEVYPSGWAERDENSQWLLDAFEDLQKFYATAAANGSGVLLYLT